MKLPLADKLHPLCTKRGEQFSSVGEDIFARVPVGAAEVENLFVCEFALASRTQREAVHQPGNFFECVTVEYLHTLRAADSPSAQLFLGAAATKWFVHRCSFGS